MKAYVLGTTSYRVAMNMTTDRHLPPYREKYPQF